MEFKVGSRIGILGGGQLARMLALAGHNLGLQMHVLSESSDDPAAQVTRHWTQGKLTDVKTIENFSQNIDYLTFESEFVDSNLVQSATKSSSVFIFPSLKNISEIQDRLTQKQLLLKCKIPTSPFVKVESISHAFSELKSSKLVFKKRMFGYDGYGTYILKNGEPSPSNLDLKNLIAEEFIPFKRELAVTLVRNKSGQIAHFPLVETKQQNSRCLWVKGETKSRYFKGLLPKLKAFLSKINYVGVITFELFETSGGLIVNELAPRVHNSCHHSIESCSVSQFTAHLLAGLDQPIGLLKTRSNFAMLNLLGSGQSDTALTTSSEVAIHWYGKLENKPGRKMGHMTALAKSSDLALKRLNSQRRKTKI